MKSTLLSRRDVDFILFEWLRVQDLIRLPRFAEHSRETLSAVLDVSEDLAERCFAPHNKKGDANEPTFDGTKVTVIDEVKQALDAAAAAGLIGMSMAEQHGGLSLPTSIAQACCAWLAAANVST